MLFGSIEAHTRKSVQLNALARNFAQNMAMEVPVLKFGQTFSYNKVYFSSLNNEHAFGLLSSFGFSSRSSLLLGPLQSKYRFAFLLYGSS